MFERFTDKARKVMELAHRESERMNHDYIGTEHVLLGLIIATPGVGITALKSLGVDLRKIRDEVERTIPRRPDMAVTVATLSWTQLTKKEIEDVITKIFTGKAFQMPKTPQTPRAKKAIEYAMEEARNLKHNYVGTEHLLLGLLSVEEGLAAKVLANFGLTVENVRHEILKLLRDGEKEA